MKRAVLIGLAAVLAVSATVAVAPAAAPGPESNDGTYAKVETGTREVTKKIGDGLRNAWTEVTKK